jgi:hypothetical protein
MWDDLAGLQLYDGTRNNIIYFVGTKEYTAIIPEKFITVEGWKGDGWQVLDPVTGAAGYMICGGLVYGGQVENVTLINGGSGATIIDHPLSKFELFLLICAVGMGFISTGLGHVVIAEYLYMASYAALPMVLALSTLGSVLLLGGLFAFAALYKSFFATIINTRRRKLVYVV